METVGARCPPAASHGPRSLTRWIFRARALGDLSARPVPTHNRRGFQSCRCMLAATRRAVLGVMKHFLAAGGPFLNTYTAKAKVMGHRPRDLSLTTLNPPLGVRRRVRCEGSV